MCYRWRFIPILDNLSLKNCALCQPLSFDTKSDFASNDPSNPFIPYPTCLLNCSNSTTKASVNAITIQIQGRRKIEKRRQHTISIPDSNTLHPHPPFAEPICKLLIAYCSQLFTGPPSPSSIPYRSRYTVQLSSKYSSGTIPQKNVSRVRIRNPDVPTLYLYSTELNKDLLLASGSCIVVFGANTE